MAATEAYPRELAVRVLTRVLSEREPLPEALNAASATGSTGRGWLQEVCSGTLRWKGRLDQMIDATALRKKPSGWLRKVLLIASYQLVAQDRTAPAAIVSETVDLVKKREGEAPARFANAILRKIAEHRENWRAMPLRDEASPAEASAWASLPQWYWERIREQQGLTWAKAFAEACLQRPALWIRARDPEWKPGPGISAEPGPVPGSWRVTQTGDVAELPGFDEGEFYVQDISSQLLVHELVRFLGPLPRPVRALDLCAAPGGKAVGMAWSGWDVSATDRDETRMALLRKSIERTRAPVHVLERAKLPGAPYDVVWVDAPCSGSGIVRRHPDVRWLRSERDLASLRGVQAALLDEGAGRVGQGGILFYSVCSVLREEGPEAVEAFLKRQECQGGRFRLDRTWFLVPQDSPSRDSPGGDGFWAGLLRREERV